MKCAFSSVNGSFLKCVSSRPQVHFEVSALGVHLRFWCEPAYCCSFLPVKIEMLYESCTNIFLFQSYVNFNILTHFLNANFEKSLHGCRVCPKESFY